MTAPGPFNNSALQYNYLKSLNVRDFGALGDNATNDTAAFKRAIAASASMTGGSRGRPIYVPFGKYYLTENLFLTNNCMMRGDGNGQNDAGSILRFADGSHGLTVAFAQTSPGYVGTGEFSTISDLAITTSGKTFPGRRGLTLFARAYVTNVRVEGFSGHGFSNFGALDGNNALGNRLWKASTAYVVGDVVRQAGTNFNTLTTTSGSLKVETGPGINQAVITRVGFNWNNTPTFSPSPSTYIIITAGSIIAGAGNANVGLWFINSATATTITATKYSNDPYLINRARMTAPVAVVATPIVATTDLVVYNQTVNRYMCTTAGTSGSSTPTATGVGITDNSVVWQSAAAVLGVADGFRLTDCRVVDVGQSGFYADGDNAQTGTINHLDTVNCIDWGVEDRSFFGNRYDMPEIAASGLGTITNEPGGNQQNMLVTNAYYEAGQPGQLLYAPAIVLQCLDGTAGKQAGDTSYRQIGSTMDPHFTTVTAGLGTVSSLTGGTIAGENDPFAFRLTSSVDSEGLKFGSFDFVNTRWNVGQLVDRLDVPIQIYRDADWAGTLGLGSVRINEVNGGSGTASSPGPGVFAANGDPKAAATPQSLPLLGGDVVINRRSLPSDAVLLSANKKGGSGATWAASTVYLQNSAVRPTVPNGYLYRRKSTSTSGFSGAVEPTWGVVIGGTTTESTGLKWETWSTDDVTLDAVYSFTDYQDDTGSPATSYTQNTRRGRITLKAGEFFVPINNIYVKDGDHPSVSCEMLDATATHWFAKCVGPLGSGGIKLQTNAPATADMIFTWALIS